ncbi:hypothetical protein AB0E55_40715 [Amycolatopsis keratiniphila]|uniref:Uncharacterized protein n=2 Tax=Amycolatopsis keratiniphila TaxID=129921 RepID=R4T0H6_9PSEU|nr:MULTISPECIES: hypothetical protein [Amycolatopsis]AGM08335.1 hypothetical protein AORI_5752 [Amycolatopsis keratiniphila]OLZ61051.1 hypothetical protein BS330_03290 [Amycolatopsis keratiniphila subsp. nogabecina]ONF74124.1 hypothetical protein AVR91_0202105 [Amycolatopsis keratiniphila subsp. keratiniphila]RSN32986.1 hypothetical protein DMC61_12545 [Amycolatopsis sp. WAC 04169]SDT97557.1 hypothetical protein SAMN04489733_0025 [Amycolatopsis keratiniphila]
MTYNQMQPATPAQPAKSATPGAGADVKTFATAVLLTFGTGVLMMDGWALLDSGFGAFLGLVAGGFGIFWWKSIHGKVFPRELSTKSVVLLTVINVVLVLLLLLQVG